MRMKKKKEKERRKRKTMTMTDKIEIYIDNKFISETEDPVVARADMYSWFMRTPFWESTSMFFYYYKNFLENKDYEAPRFGKPESMEKNLFFMEGDNPYVCLRCRQPSEIVGFCSTCYEDIYGLNVKKEIELPLEDIKAHPRFLEIVEADPVYTDKIKKSIQENGMKNAIVIDGDNRVLVGHHRYFIAKALGWETIRCRYNDINFNHGYFYEGKGSNVFVVRMDGALYMSTSEINDIMPVLLDFQRQNINKTMVLECYLNAGSDIRLRNVFIPERGDVVDPTWQDWYIRKFNKKPKIGRFS